MKSLNGNQSAARQNRIAFLQRHHINPEDTTLHTLSYGGNNYRRYLTLDSTTKGDGIIRNSTIDADAVVVAEPNHAVLLPLGDCVGAVIHDPTQNILMISHLGRHNLEQYGGTKCIQYLIDQYKVDPSTLIVQLSPAAGGENYPLRAFNDRSMYDVTTEQLTTAGVLTENILTSSTDTTTHSDYYSHSEYLRGNRDKDGRFAIVAVMN